MKILVFGGTVFVGRHIVASALKAGHEVTMFNRGVTGRDLFPGVERIHGDRRADLSPLVGRKWDAVIDVSGYFPAEVRAAATVLKDNVLHYTFISTGSVYKDWTRPDQDETAALALPIPGAAETAPEMYGPLKVMCEGAVSELFPTRALIVRPGIVGGPYDPSARLTWWAWRAAAGGEMLAPGDPLRPVQVIDARDLADWVVATTVRRAAGTYNAFGLKLTMRSLIETCRETAGHRTTAVWVPDDFVHNHAEGPNEDIPPLWFPGIHGSFDSAGAVGLGLNRRPMADTVLDLLAWLQADPTGRYSTDTWDRARETAVLNSWHESGKGALR